MEEAGINPQNDSALFQHLFQYLKRVIAAALGHSNALFRQGPFTCNHAAWTKDARPATAGRINDEVRIRCKVSESLTTEGSAEESGRRGVHRNGMG